MIYLTGKQIDSLFEENTSGDVIFCPSGILGTPKNVGYKIGTMAVVNKIKREIRIFHLFMTILFFVLVSTFNIYFVIVWGLFVILGNLYFTRVTARNFPQSQMSASFKKNFLKLQREYSKYYLATGLILTALLFLFFKK